MKFLVTFVRLSRKTRRRMGKSETATIDTMEGTPISNSFYHDGKPTPLWMERRFEMLRQDGNQTCKVVDIREVE